MSKKEIRKRAVLIAGSLWEDVYDAPDWGSLADCLNACAHHRNEGTDGDLNDEDRDGLLALARKARP